MPPAKSPAPKVVIRPTTGLPPRNYRLSAKTFYASLPPDERDSHIAREEQEFKQIQSLPHERLAPTCSEYTESAWKEFERASKNYYDVQNGKQSIMARFLPEAIAGAEWILSAKTGKFVRFLKDMTEEEQLAFIEEHFRANLSINKLKADVNKIRMTCQEFSRVALDSFAGKFMTLIHITYTEVWQRTKLETQTNIFVRAISPLHLSQSIALELKEQEHSDIYEAFVIINKAADREVERLLGNDKAKASESERSLPKPKAISADDSPVLDIRANVLKAGDDPCDNCMHFGHPKSKLRHTSANCRSACSCGKEPPHLAAAKGVILCPHWKKTTMLLTVDDASDDDEDGDVAGGHFANMIRFYPSDDDDTDTCPDGIPH